VHPPPLSLRDADCLSPASPHDTSRPAPFSPLDNLWRDIADLAGDAADPTGDMVDDGKGPNPTWRQQCKNQSADQLWGVTCPDLIDEGELVSSFQVQEEKLTSAIVEGDNVDFFLCKILAVCFSVSENLLCPFL